MTPEKAFERRWALALLDQVFQQLQQECASAGKATLFAELRPFLTNESDESCPEVAARLQIPKATLKVLIHRLRRRYGQLLREQIAKTVSSPAEVEDEIRDLFAALR